MIINANVQNKRLTFEGAPYIVCGNDDYKIHFTFDAEWEAELTRTACFVYVLDGRLVRQDVPFNSNEVAVPPVYNTSEVRVGLFSGTKRTTTAGHIPCVPSIRCGAAVPGELTLDQYEQLMEIVTRLDSPERVDELVQQYFQEHPVDKYFTPHVSEDGVLSWTNNAGLENPPDMIIKGGHGEPGRDGKDGAISFNDMTEEQHADLVARLDENGLRMQKGSPYGVFAVGKFADMTSVDSFTLDTLKNIHTIEKNVYTSGNYYATPRTLVGIYKDGANYFKLYIQGYNVLLEHVVAGTKTTKTYTNTVRTLTPYSDVYTTMDFDIGVVRVVGRLGDTIATIIEEDISAYDLSAFDTFKIICGAGKYQGYQSVIYVRINDYFNHLELLKFKQTVADYNSLPVVSGEKNVYYPTSLTIGGTVTSTISNTHKVANVSMTAENYFAMNGTSTEVSGKQRITGVVRFKCTNIAEGSYLRTGANSTTHAVSEDGTESVNMAQGFAPREGVWYYLATTTAAGWAYTMSYGVRAKGDFTIEVEALYFAYPQSINLCADTWNGSHFTGALPFSGTNVNFTSVTLYESRMSTMDFVPRFAFCADVSTGVDKTLYINGGTNKIAVGTF